MLNEFIHKEAWDLKKLTTRKRTEEEKLKLELDKVKITNVDNY